MQGKHFFKRAAACSAPSVWASQDSGHNFGWLQQAEEFFSLTRREGNTR